MSCEARHEKMTGERQKQQHIRQSTSQEEAKQSQGMHRACPPIARRAGVGANQPLVVRQTSNCKSAGVSEIYRGRSPYCMQQIMILIICTSACTVCRPTEIRRDLFLLIEHTPSSSTPGLGRGGCHRKCKYTSLGFQWLLTRC